MEQPLKAVVGIMGVVAIAVGAILWSGYAISLIWGWYAVKLLGLPSLSLAGAIGLSCLANCFQQYHEVKQDPNSDATSRLIKATGIAFFRPAFLIVLAWIAMQWM